MKIGINKKNKNIIIDSDTLNKHGIIAGSSGSGKTTTIKTLSSKLNDKGIPLLLFDAKGDLKDLLQAKQGALYTFKGDHGIPLQTSLNTLGINLLSNILELNATQQGIVTTCFLIAQDQGMEIITIEDLEKLFLYAIDNNENLIIKYGRLSNVSINTIRRKINTLKLEKLDHIFNLDNFNYKDIIDKKEINIIDSVQLVKYPKLYASIIVMILRQFYDNLTDNEKDDPKALIFIDEAHLLFKDTNKHMIEEIEQITKLIRSKGIGLFFISQSIYDLPNDILNQLTLKIQHQLHLLTTKDFSRARAIATTFTDNKQARDETVNKIRGLSVGRALIQYETDQGLLNDVIQVDYIYKDIISFEKLLELTPAPKEDHQVQRSRSKQQAQEGSKKWLQLILIVTALIFLYLLF